MFGLRPCVPIVGRGGARVRQTGREFWPATPCRKRNMQTFLPYPCFQTSAWCLDYRRLGKQRVEAKQLLLALGIPVGGHIPKQSSWANHPAAKMWAGYEYALSLYGHYICEAWRRRGYKDTLMPEFTEVMRSHQVNGIDLVMPDWLGDEAFHASHRSNLLRKDPDHYGQFGWAEPSDLPYVWPDEGGL